MSRKSRDHRRWRRMHYNRLIAKGVSPDEARAQSYQWLEQRIKRGREQQHRERMRAQEIRSFEARALHEYNHPRDFNDGLDPG